MWIVWIAPNSKFTWRKQMPPKLHSCTVQCILQSNNMPKSWGPLLHHWQSRKVHCKSITSLQRDCWNWRLLQRYRISSYSFLPWIVSSLELFPQQKFSLRSENLKYCSNYLDWPHFPNSKKCNFCGNYLRKYGIQLKR